MHIEKIIKDRGLVALAERDGIEKALRCAFCEGQLFTLEQMAMDLRESDKPGDECHGWGPIAAERIERFLHGDEDN